MSVHIICLTSGGGIPLFTRTKGQTENLPFSLIGSLNGVHMFGKSQNFELVSTETEEYCVTWKEFHDSVVLIGVAGGSTTLVLLKLLESIFHSMVLIIGIDEIKQQRNIERLKRELRVGHPIVDRLIDSLDTGDALTKYASDLVSLAECILTPQNASFQSVLSSYSECIDTMFCCILIHGKIACATESWWGLSSDEIKVLSLLAVAENTQTTKDIPVFLPIKSPNIAFRFVAVSVMPEVQVCALCGPSPPLEDIERTAGLCFKPVTPEILTAACQCHPKNFPLHLSLDSGVMGILLINATFGKYIISANPQLNSSTQRPTHGFQRINILKSFYYRWVLDHLIDVNQECIEEQVNDPKNKDDKSTETKLNCKVKETYWCSEYHKCHAMRIGDNVLCVLYNSSIPTPAMRLITERSLKLIISEKYICW